MALTPSTMLPLGTPAPNFALPDTEGTTVRRSDFANRPLLVMFLCNHCPFVKHVRGHLAPTCREYQQKGVAVVAINANDAAASPDDLARLLRDADPIDPASRRTLAELVDELGKALRSAPVPPAEVAHLAETTTRLAESLHRRHDQDRVRTLRERFEQALVNAEVQHP